MSAQVAIGTVAGASILGVGVPWLLLAMLVPSLESSERATVSNYRGKRVFYGLGIVWLVWAGCAIVGGVLGASIVEGRSVLAVLTLAGPLVLVAFAMGVVDDAYGTSESRGFKGHLKSMLAGRLTTGGLKLIGIGAASLVAALVIAGVAPWGGQQPTVGLGVVVLVAGAAIALTSNFVNLTDLRPGRALKVYSLLAVGAVLSVVLGLAPRLGQVGESTLPVAVGALALLLFMLGPVAATWRYDLGERGMLGDAGANAMGAAAGMLIVSGLPAWGIGVYFAVMLAANLASERYSFSRIIESNPVLRGLDALGRCTETETSDEHEEPSRQQSTGPE